MPTILGVDIAGLIGANLGGKLLPATLTRVTPGAYNLTTPTSGNQPTSTAYSCRAVLTKFESIFVGKDLTRAFAGECMILLATVSGGKVPANGDTITIKCSDNITRTLVIDGPVDIDPAGAQATCKVSG